MHDHPIDPHGYGRTNWCAMNRHHKCDYRIGGHLEHGKPFPECYLTMPHESGRGGCFYPPGRPKIVTPSHVYRCPCECHDSRQVPMFEVGDA